MSTVRTNAAAAMLGVSPNTLRNWERRFSYPNPRRSEGGHRQFELAEIETLKQAFEETHNISSAISIARERGAGVGSPGGLRGALEAFNQERADRMLEESLSVRSMERTVQTTLLPAVESLAGGSGQQAGSRQQGGSGQRGESGQQGESGQRGREVSPEYAFAWRYATGWLASAQRVAPPATREQGVVIFDASRPLEIDALYIQALELFLRRAGLRVLTLPSQLQAARLAGALRALRPGAAVLSGAHASLDELGRLIYTVRQTEEKQVEVVDYRGALPDTGASTVLRLGEQPQAAAVTLCERLSGGAHSARTPLCAAPAGVC